MSTVANGCGVGYIWFITVWVLPFPHVKCRTGARRRVCHGFEDRGGRVTGRALGDFFSRKYTFLVFFCLAHLGLGSVRRHLESTFERCISCLSFLSFPRADGECVAKWQASGHGTGNGFFSSRCSCVLLLRARRVSSVPPTCCSPEGCAMRYAALGQRRCRWSPGAALCHVRGYAGS